MIPLLLVLLLASSISESFPERLSPIVQTRLGGIRGTYKVSYGGRKYEAYEGIPYAMPPTLARRFQPPEMIEEWVGNLSATKVASPCIQYSHTPMKPQDRVEGDEDCLYLNVYVPVHENSKALPVLFAIHGGGFQFGSANTGPDFLMDRDVIVVTMNYRLGSFGFLSTEDEHVFGNMGLKDQSMALRWTSDNIENFGGDPKKITLIGISAGGASVHYHYLSPMSRGLFQNGISFSGGVFGPGKQTENAREKTHKLADLLGCPTNDVSIMVDCLRYRPPRALVQATSHFMPFLYNPFTPFGPVVEKASDRPFVDRSPMEIIKSGDVADVLWVSGVVSEEGLYPAAEFVNNDEVLKDLNQNWEKIAPHLLDYNFTIPLDKHAEVARKIRKHYLNDKPIDRSTAKELIAMIGDRLYVADGEKAAKWQAKVTKSQVLFWYYSYRASTSFSDIFTMSHNNYGVCHSDDISMIFKNGHIYPPASTKDREMQIKLIDLVVSVAEKGYPDIGLKFEWKKVDTSSETLDYLHIAAPGDIKLEKSDNLGQKRFWSTIDFNENRVDENIGEEITTFVKTSNGGVLGTYKTSFSGRKYKSYEGIPYASPPVLQKRFQPPEAIGKWVKTLSATKPSSPCIQLSHDPLNYTVIGEEDCLYLNIYVPEQKTSKLLPVIFEIHGGAFQYGETFKNPSYLMDKHVIVVTINYRLGIFGFLSTEDENILGNMGLKDQSLALRWVYDNIEYFGGDKKRITLIGESAGGASVHYHYLSPMSRGLFQNGISFSGGAFGPGKQTENSREKALKLASIIGCQTENIPDIVKCLQFKPAKILAETTKYFMPWLYNPFTPFGPVVEKFGDEPFVNRSPIEIIKSNDVADVLWITSVTNNEGLYPAAEFINEVDLLKDLNEKWENIAPHLLDYNFTLPLDKHTSIARKIRKHYFGDKSIDKNSINELVNVIGDRLYVLDGETAARWQATVNKSPVLFLKYNYRASTSLSDYYSKTRTNYGVSHCDDIYMIFDNDIIYPPKTTENRAMQIKLIDYVVSVAEKGYPDFGLDFEWKRVDPLSEDFEFLLVEGPNNIQLASDNNLGNKNFWATIEFNENKL